jgi:putative ABC transport system permease protein
MLKNYFKIAVRNLLRNKVFSFVNVAGMAVGLSSCLVIGLFVANELMYDKFHSKHARIFRLVSDLTTNNSTSNIATTPAPWAPLLEADYPQIESSVRILKDDRSLVGRQDQQKNFELVLFADPSVFKIFDFPMTSGNPARALSDPNTAVLTTTTAKRYFGEEDPIGKALQVATPFGQELTVTITGITADVPQQSHFHYNIILSISTLGDISGFWSYHMYHTYLLLKNPSDRSQLEKMFPAFAEKYVNHNPRADGQVKLFLQPLTDIHLRSQLAGDIEPNGNITYVYILSGIALFILALACFNFMNLSTAQSLLRGKEVGLRKTVGANQRQLISQFLGEAIILMVLAAFLAVIITQAVLPFFNLVSQRQLNISTLLDPFIVFIILLFLLIIAVIAGLYPSLVLSAFKPADVLKGKFHKSTGGNGLRKTLVTIQFAVSIILVACTIILYSQLDFLKNKDLGFDRSHVMIMTIPRGSYGDIITTFENTLKANTSVVSASASSSVPADHIPINLVRPEGSANKESRSMEMLFVDHGFIKTTGMQVVAGRDFSEQFVTDPQEAFIINEQAVKELGWKSPQDALGKKFEWVLPDAVLKSGKIIGVIKDINFRPLNFKIQPLVIHIQPNRLQYVYVRFQPGRVDENIKMLETQFKATFPSQPFEFTFLDQTIQRLYENEQRLGKIFTYGSVLTIIIASLGIFALSTHSAKQRVKEVGIRKVLGANTGDILKLSSKEFLTLVLLANLIAWPIAWYMMSKGLEAYAYRIDMHWTVFAVSGLLVLSVAMITVSFEAIKASLSNPVDSLRNE